MWAANFQRLTFESNAVEGHCLRRFVNRTKLEEGKVFVEVDLTGKHGIAKSLTEAAGVHLRVEVVHHLLFAAAKGNVADVQAASLPGDG